MSSVKLGVGSVVSVGLIELVVVGVLFMGKIVGNIGTIDVEVVDVGVVDVGVEVLGVGVVVGLGVIGVGIAVVGGIGVGIGVVRDVEDSSPNVRPGPVADP